MSSSGGPNIPQFLSTHPSHEKRIKDLEEFMPTALSYYEPYNGE
jgi:Zn-dependent protease with chaperone function